MAARKKTPEEISERRASKALSRAYRATLVSSDYCEETGGGVVVIDEVDKARQITMAYFFEPRLINRYFLRRELTSAHERIDPIRTLQAELAAIKAARIAPHNLGVGDIIADCWGASTHDVTFYKIVSIPHPRKIEVVTLGDHFVSGDYFSGTKMPTNPDGPVSPDSPRIVFDVSMADGTACVKTGGSIHHARKWKGNPISVSGAD